MFDLISSIGGLCGLFIGVSFVSLFEIGELFIEAIFILCMKDSKLKAKPTKDNWCGRRVTSLNASRLDYRIKQLETETNFDHLKTRSI